MSAQTLTVAQLLAKRHRLDPEYAVYLARMLERLRLFRPRPGDEICQEGDPADRLFFLFRGTVMVRKKDYQGQPQDLARMGAPAMFGHMALVGNAPRSATCVAEPDCVVGALGRGVFDELMNDQGPEGEAFRWLLIASMIMQHGKGAQRLRRLMVKAREADLDVGEASILSASLEGW